MAQLPMSEQEFAARRNRLAFLKKFLDQKPSLRAADQIAADPSAAQLGVADTQWQVLELALATGDLSTARVALETLAYDMELAAVAPLRWLGAASLARDVPEGGWSRGVAAARSEPLVELLWAAWFAQGYRQAPPGLPDAAYCARIYRLEPLLPDGAYEDRSEAYAVLIALYSDYAARLKVQTRREPTFPTGWSLVDWPLLLFHAAIIRQGGELPVSTRLLSPVPVPAGIRAVEAFLAETAEDLTGGQGRHR